MTRDRENSREGRAGLPVELTSFVGRRRELAQGRRALREARLVTLVGPGGVGKTRLALRLARRVERGFGDGVAWVELGAQPDPASLASEVAVALDLDTQGQPADQAVAAYVSGRHLLLVLDNCEHLLQACAELVVALLEVAPRVRVLATSRQPLKAGAEHRLEVEPLLVPTAEEASSGAIAHVEAVALLADRARSVDPRFQIQAGNAEDVSRLCRQLDGIPLAIELAAARLRALSVSQLADRLDQRLALLDRGPRTVAPRHQTLRALVDWSYGLCSPAEQRLWARMSVFQGGADLAAITTVCGDPEQPAEPPIEQVLAALVDKSVVTASETHGRTRYRLLEVIREYGAERLAEHDQTASIRDRHRDFFVARSEARADTWFGPDQAALLEAANEDLGNLRAAFDHALNGSSDPSAALRLTYATLWYWVTAGAMQEGTGWFDRVLADRHEDTPEMLRALTAAANLAAALSDVETASAYARRAVSVPPVEVEPADRAARHQALAVLASATGDHEAALRHYAEAAREHELAADAARRVGDLLNVAVINMALDRLQEATDVLGTAMRICDEHSERFDKPDVLCIYADALGQLGRTDEALTVLHDIVGNTPGRRPFTMAVAVELLARTHAAVGQEHRAAVLLGVRSRLHQDFGVAPGPYIKNGYWALEKQLGEALGGTTYQTAHAEGFSMSLASALRFAVGSSAADPESWQLRRPLSKREQQVAGLLARGFSNKEIAEELVISQRTAEGHVAKVLDKLGAHSRDQVAAWLTAPSSPAG